MSSLVTVNAGTGGRKSYGSGARSAIGTSLYFIQSGCLLGDAPQVPPICGVPGPKETIIGSGSRRTKAAGALLRRPQTTARHRLRGLPLLPDPSTGGIRVKR